MVCACSLSRCHDQCTCLENEQSSTTACSCEPALPYHDDVHGILCTSPLTLASLFNHNRDSNMAHRSLKLMKMSHAWHCEFQYGIDYYGNYTTFFLCTFHLNILNFTLLVSDDNSHEGRNEFVKMSVTNSQLSAISMS